MLLVKSWNVKHNSERVFRYFASAVNSDYRVQNVIENILMLSVVIQALKKVGYVPLFTFCKSLFDIQRLGFWSHLA